MSGTKRGQQNNPRKQKLNDKKEKKINHLEIIMNAKMSLYISVMVSPLKQTRAKDGDAIKYKQNSIPKQE